MKALILKYEGTHPLGTKLINEMFIGIWAQVMYQKEEHNCSFDQLPN